MTLLIVLVVVILLLIAFFKNPLTIRSHWQHFYDNVQFSTQDFYDHVEGGLRERKMDRLDYSKESFLEAHIMSAKREYLRVTKNEHVFYICATPFGTGMFVSWWLCTKDETFINRIPLVSKLAGKDRNNKTFYQMDTEAMYRSIVHASVVETADTITIPKGVRLSELERQFNAGSK